MLDDLYILTIYILYMRIRPFVSHFLQIRQVFSIKCQTNPLSVSPTKKGNLKKL